MTTRKFDLETIAQINRAPRAEREGGRKRGRRGGRGRASSPAHDRHISLATPQAEISGRLVRHEQKMLNVRVQDACATPANAARLAATTYFGWVTGSADAWPTSVSPTTGKVDMAFLRDLAAHFVGVLPPQNGNLPVVLSVLCPVRWDGQRVVVDRPYVRDVIQLASSPEDAYDPCSGRLHRGRESGWLRAALVAANNLLKVVEVGGDADGGWRSDPVADSLGLRDRPWAPTARYVTERKDWAAPEGVSCDEAGNDLVVSLDDLVRVGGTIEGGEAVAMFVFNDAAEVFTGEITAIPGYMPWTCLTDRRAYDVDVQVDAYHLKYTL